MSRTARLTVLLLLLLASLGGAASAATPAEKAAQAAWKDLAKVRLKSFKQSMAAVTAEADTSFDALVGALKDPQYYAFDCGEDLAELYAAAYHEVQAAVEDVVAELDAAGSALLVPLGQDHVKGFMAGDGGTTDQALAEIRKRVAKFDKFMAKRVAKVRKAVAKAGPDELRLSAVLYPLPVTVSPLPHASSSVLNGRRPNAPLAAFGVTRDCSEMYGVTCGITSCQLLVVRIKEDEHTVTTDAPTPSARGVYATRRLFTIGPCNMSFEAFEHDTNVYWTSFVGAAVD